MKTVFTEKTDWRRVGKAKPRCIVVGANNGQGGAIEACANSVKPLKTYPQEWSGDEQGIIDEGLDPAPGVETMAMAKPENRMEAALGQKDTAGFATERDLKVKDMDTTTITKNQPAQPRYAAIGRSAVAAKSREERVAEKQASKESRKRGRDLHAGLELLDLDFLLDMVENVESAEEHEVLMRKLSFHELSRTGRIGEVDSNALRYYCLDEEGLYDKQVQCEAMKELAARTMRSMGH